MKPEPKKKLPNKKVISSAKFEAKEQFTKSALENLKTEKDRLVNSLKKSGEIKESKRKVALIFKDYKADFLKRAELNKSKIVSDLKKSSV